MGQRKRHIIQAAATLLTNANIGGFFTGKIWQGDSKSVCVPGLNCYSCPGAVGACPIGALQSSLGGRGRGRGQGQGQGLPYYVVGTLILFGVLFGRLICGFLCPFGFIQDLLHKLPGRKLRVPERLDRPARRLKYAVLLVLVIAMPIFFSGGFGSSSPWFCKLVCPAGTLEGGIPLVLKNEGLRSSLGFLFGWKMLLLIITVVSSILIFRPFCKYVCPLGAIYSLFNRHSFYKMSLDADKCVNCGACERVCGMGVSVRKDINSAECIRCGACKDACPKSAISSGFKFK